MQRRVVSLLMILMLALQSIVSAAAYVVPDTSANAAHHCEGHEKAGPDCKCCGDTGALSASCSVMCSGATAAPAVRFIIPHDSAERASRFIARWTVGPAYSPLNPPPIS